MQKKVMESILIIVSALVLTDAAIDPDMELQLIGVGQWTVALSRFLQSNTFNPLTQLTNVNEETVVSIQKSIAIRDVCMNQNSYVLQLRSTLPYEGYNAQTLVAEMAYGCLVIGAQNVPYGATYQARSAVDDCYSRLHGQYWPTVQPSATNSPIPYKFVHAIAH